MAGVAAVGVITLVRRGIPELQRYIKMEKM
jgi:hypothetical protein